MPKKGNLPVRCQGTRWIGHKRRALQRIVDRFGVYIIHLTNLIEDPAVKPADKCKLKGYLRKWSQGKMLIGCSMYIDILKAPSILSLVLQEDGMDIIQGIKAILKSVSYLQSLNKEAPKEWSTVKLTLTRIADEGGSKVYQGSDLSNYTEAMLRKCFTDGLADLKNLDTALKERLSWSDTNLLRSIIVFLDTRCWSRPMANEDSGDDNAQVKEAVEDIVSIFREPLEAKGTSTFSIQDEVDEVVDFYRQYLNPEESYKKVWYKIFTAPDARKWPTVILLSELLFSLPFTNSTVERAFSIMNIIKTDRHTSLNDSTLDDLMEINVEGPPPEDFSSEHAVSLWWKDCTRRPNQARRKEYRQRATGSEDDTGSRESGSMEPSRSTMTLDAWDDWMIIDASNSDS